MRQTWDSCVSTARVPVSPRRRSVWASADWLGAQPALRRRPMRPPADNQLQEVVVTAQFRQQSAQTAPLAITAVSAQQLDERSVASVNDLNAIAPNVSITGGTTTLGPVAQIFIRGIGQSDGHPGLEPGVGLYVDDVYHGLMLGSEMDLTDLDRIEVLRGPQGTLSGKNSIGGSIKLFSKKPDDNTDGYAEAGYGSFNRINVRAGGNFTLIQDKLYVRVSGVSKTCRRLHDAPRLRLRERGDPPAFIKGARCRAASSARKVARTCMRRAWRCAGSPTTASRTISIASVTADRSEVPALKLLYSNNSQKFPNGQPFIPGGGSQFITGPSSYTTYATYIVPSFTDPAVYNGQAGRRHARRGTASNHQPDELLRHHRHVHLEARPSTTRSRPSPDTCATTGRSRAKSATRPTLPRHCATPGPSGSSRKRSG